MRINTRGYLASFRRSKASVSAISIISALAALSATTALAQDHSWKQNFAACAGNSPFIENLLEKHEQNHRPLMRIGDMQAWAIKGEDGEPAIALTTDDGLTIIGTIIGPQGEDISSALLSTVPNPDAIDVAKAHEQSVAQPTAREPLQSRAPAAPNMSRALTSLAAPRKNGTPPGPTVETHSSVAEPASAPITATQTPTTEQQAGMNTIFQQATDERIWFSAGTAKPGAPVVYMLADPECPHCQWTIDNMRGQIHSGDIDLRIIFAPITGVGGFNTSLSILHSEEVPQTFMNHMTSITRGTPAVTQMDTNTADRAVVQGIVDNINWMRTNRMPGVPFFLYMTDDGARFAFSELPSNILTEAKPL